MSLLLKFANHGVIHGDFNEFNIMIDDEANPIIIDFPQMISVAHGQAEFYFNRDVQCIKDFFRRRLTNIKSTKRIEYIQLYRGYTNNIQNKKVF